LPHRSYQFDRTISREVLENYLARAISMEGIFNGRGDLQDNIRMLTGIGAKYIGRSLCLWGAEMNFLDNIERAKALVPKALAGDPDMLGSLRVRDRESKGRPDRCPGMGVQRDGSTC
jgi:hypothetical protein